MRRVRKGKRKKQKILKDKMWGSEGIREELPRAHIKVLNATSI